MARTKPTDSAEPLANAFAIVPVKGGGYVVREYLVPETSTVHQDGPVDTFAACLGRVTKEHAKVAK